MAGAVVHFEVLGQDLARLKAFYGELLGWRFQEMPEMSYAMVEKGEGGIGGGVGVAQQGAGWATFYVHVDALGESLARAEGMGGKVLVPPVTLPDGASYAVIGDPEGHPVGLFQPA